MSGTYQVDHVAQIMGDLESVGSVTVIGTILGIGGTVAVSGGAGGGTTVTVDHGTVTITNPGSGGTVNNIATGTQQTLGTVGVVNTIVTGTLASAGTTTGVGVVSNLTNGSVNILTGTLQSSGSTTGVGGTVIMTKSYSSFNYRATAGTTTIKSGAGIVHVLAGTYTGLGTLYNSAGTSAAIIWGGVIGQAPLYFDLAFGSLTWAGTGASALKIIYT